MTTFPPPSARHNLGDQPTLDAVFKLVRDDPTLSSRKREDMACALRSLARAIGQPIETCPANPEYINKRLKAFKPMQAGFSTARWRNLLCLSRAALAHVGLVHMPGRHREPLSPPWEALFRQLPPHRGRFALTRFSHYCTAQGIAPDSVDDAALDGFRTALTEQSLSKNPREVHRVACLEWNKAAASVPAWPRRRVGVPNYRRDYALPWASFPVSLKADIDAYLSRMAGEDLLAIGEFRALRPASLQTRATQLHAFASALVLQGRDPQSLRTLADMVHGDAARLGLRFYLDRKGGKTSSQINGLAHMLLSIARHWVGVDAGQEKILKQFCKGTAFAGGGMTEKNLARTRQFANPANMAALAVLPHDLLLEAMQAPVIDKRVARLVQTAVAVEMLVLFTPRISNLAELDTQRHLPQHGRATRLLAIPGSQVKNGMAIDAVLPGDTVKLLDIYEKHYRPVLADQASSWLFPGRDGKHKSPGMLGKQITDCVRTRLGLVVNAHLFRHIGVKSYLAAHPNGYGVMQRVLAHRNANTMTKFYSDNDTTAAIKRYDEHILGLRPKLVLPSPRRGKKPPANRGNKPPTGGGKKPPTGSGSKG